MILFLMVSLQCLALPLPSEFVRAIHVVETSGRLGGIKGDSGKAFGPLQIHFACWRDSGVKGAYSRCADYNYSVTVLTGYLNRYARNAIKSHDYQTLARVWNGGPMGYRNEKTIEYWKKVKKHL